MNPGRAIRIGLASVACIASTAAVPAPAAARTAASRQAVSAQESPAAPSVEYEGAIATGLAVRRLGNTLRVLHVGAHPDDENTALLTPLTLGAGADVAYLSLTRGEGGQNSIGPELGVALGLIRSEELIAARRVDGATQYFTRAIDFGFSKNAAETFTHWPRDSVLADVVAVIRHFRPDIVIPAWTGTRRDGHGQHEAAGILALEAVRASADPARFPEQVADGLRPHAVDRFYWSARYLDAEPDVEFDTGRLDPLLGRSYYQLAMASRSRHRSQDMGARQAPGPAHTAFVLVDPSAPPALDPAASNGSRHLPGSPSADRRPAGDGAISLVERAERASVAPVVVTTLRRYGEQIDAAAKRLSLLRPTGSTPALLGARMNLHRLQRLYARFLDSIESPRPELLDLRFHIDRELEDLDRALISASGIRFEATVDREVVSPGGEIILELSAWHGGPTSVHVEFRPLLPDGWTAEAIRSGSDTTSGGVRVRPGARVVRRYRVQVPQHADLTQPYFLLMSPEEGEESLYSWPVGRHVGVPFDRDAVRGEFRLDFQPVMATAFARPRAVRSAAWIGVDPQGGEFRRPLRVVPTASLAIARPVAVLARGDGSAPEGGAEEAPRRLEVRVALQTREGFPGGTLRVAAPAGWTARPASQAIPAGGVSEDAFTIEVEPPLWTPPGEYHAGALLELPSCAEEMPCAAVRTVGRGFDVVDYPHIQPHHYYRPAVSRIRVIEARVADVTVGYVEGTPDGIPEALDQLGVAWEPLETSDLADGDLSRFDVIVTGTRAYEFRPDLVAHNERILDWTRSGGTLIVNYNKYPALLGSYAPWPVSIASPHGRVTDEAATVTILEPEHPVFHVPNEIGPGDWDGWVQERGLYFWDSWDGPLVPLVAMSDRDEAPLEGALLAGPLGEGTYVYSALSLFRQLPEGVPGAYRLLANLVSLGAR